jgi:hypothetical protein
VWKKIKNEAIHLRYFPTFADLVSKVTATLQRYAALPHELIAVAGVCRQLSHPTA